MINIKRIRKITAKSKLETINKYIKWCAERGQDHLDINLKDPYNDKHIDENVIKSLESKGFKVVRNDDSSVVISWKE